MDWNVHFPLFISPDSKLANGLRTMTKNVEIADIGCGFGGLIVALSTVYPDTLMLGWSFEYVMVRT